MSEAAMPTDRESLHGSAPDKSHIAILIIDMINDLDFPEGEQLLSHALPAAQKIATLRQRANQAGVPVVYVNDNFGRWRSDFRAQVEHCLEPGCRGREIAALLRPGDDDYFVLKPKHSGFYSTTLDVLLRYLEVKSLIITGMAANICVLFTANDAYQRDYQLYVPADCVASNNIAENDAALGHMHQILKADIRPADEIDLKE